MTGRRLVFALAACLPLGFPGCQSRPPAEPAGDVPPPPASSTQRTLQAVPRPGVLIRRHLLRGLHATGLAWAPSGKFLAVAGEGVKLLDPASGSLLPDRIPPGVHGPGLAWSPDGSRLATAGPGSPRLAVVDPGAGVLLASEDEGNVAPGVLSFAPDGKSLAYNGAGGPGSPVIGTPEGPFIYFADSSTGRTLRALKTGPADVRDLRHAPDGRLLAVAEDVLALRDPDSGELRRRTSVPLGVLDWSPDSRWVVGLHGNEIILVEAATGLEAGRFPADSSISVSDSGRIRTGRRLRCFAVSPRDFLAATGTDDGRIDLWDLRHGRRAGSYSSDGPAAATNWISLLAFSRDGRQLAAGCRDGLLLLQVGLVGRDEGPGLEPAQLDGTWESLASGDPRRSRQGAAWLSADPEAAVPYLRRRLESPATAAHLAAILAGLGSEDPAERDAAEAAALARPDLVEAYRSAEAADPEVRARLRGIVAKLEAAPEGPGLLRARDLAIQALELAGTPSAREALESLARSLPLARERAAARGAARRLAGR